MYDYESDVLSARMCDIEKIEISSRRLGPGVNNYLKGRSVTQFRPTYSCVNGAGGSAQATNSHLFSSFGRITYRIVFNIRSFLIVNFFILSVLEA